MGGASTLGRWAEATFGQSLVFSFSGLLIASLIFNLPFAIQPVQRALESIPVNVRHAAACCGLSWWRTLWRIELPLAWPGIVSSLVMTFAHTLGEFGVVLMVGGSIPGETKTIAISIYDRVQAFDTAAAGQMSAVLLLLSLGAISISYYATNRLKRHHA
jgi:molybdate transport system permease protein